MLKIKTALILSLLLTSTFLCIGEVEASQGQATVYIVCLPGVPTADSWVNDTQRVKDGAIDACMLQGQYIELNVPRAHPRRNVDYPPYYEVTPHVVTSWTEYTNVIASYSGVIVVNAHGQ